MFRVGSAKYLVKIAAERMIVGGEECLGLCDELGRRILISPALPIDRRLWILAHELGHAHVLATGMPTDLEGLCDLIATVFDLAMRDLVNAGGEEALKRLNPGEELGLATARVGLSSNRYCRCCGASVAGGSVKVSPTGDGHVEIRVPCRHCDMTSIWREMANHGGLPTGIVVGDPRVVSGSYEGAVTDGELRYVMD